MIPSHPSQTRPKLSAAVLAALQKQPDEAGSDPIDPQDSIAFPDLPKFSLLARAREFEETKPNRGKDEVRRMKDETGREASGPEHQAPNQIENQKSQIKNPPPLSQTFQNLPESSILTRSNEFEKTKPNGGHDELGAMAPMLPPRQLAAARLLMSGRAVGEVASEMGVTRQTIGAWKRSEAFVKEMHRLHELMAKEVARR